MTLEAAFFNSKNAFSQENVVSLVNAVANGNPVNNITMSVLRKMNAVANSN